jgi:5-methylcytosine-specific restriction enzyme B
MIPKNITEQHVLEAIKDIDANGIKYPLTKSRKVNLVFNDKAYPPKLTISIANKFANGEELFWRSFHTDEAQKYLIGLSPKFKIEPKSNDPVAALIEKYKKHVRENKLEGEVYKWELLEKFKGRPDVNATDFFEEIKSINYSNLIYPVGVTVIHHLAKERTEPYRQCFKILFNESIPLAKRLKQFNSDTLKIYREIVPQEKFSHHQDERTMATFLTYFNPDKYVLYKDSFYQKYCKLIGEKPKGKGEKYLHYLELIDDLIEEYINDDAALINMINEIIPSDAFHDEQHKVLAQDILYTMLDKGIDEIDIEDASVFKISMREFTPEELEESIKENKILVHKDTKSKGQSHERQGETFESKINIGDYFYLTYGNGAGCIKLIGRVTGDAVPAVLNDYGDEGWLERSFELIKSSKNKSKYTGANKWWTPNHNSTCIEIKSEELNEANKILFEPYFMSRLITDIKENGTIVSGDSTILRTKSQNITSLNQILFGPPGTGKTYNSINKAIAILNPEFNLLQNRERLKEEYDRLTNEKQIAFTTFHQSMSYEDFIEGIKPNLDGGDEDELEYVMKPGIFMKQCAYAAYFCYLKSQQAAPQSSIYTFDELYDSFVDDVKEKIEKGKTPIFKTLNEKEVTIKKINKNNSIIASAKNSKAKDVAPLTKENIQKLYDKFKSIAQITELKQVKEAVQVTPRMTEFYAVFSGLKTFEKSFTPEDRVEDSIPVLDEPVILKKFSGGVFNDAVIKFGKVSKPVVLIIDEINRGNVSQIFGELITLIEEDKRLGKEESLEVTLPYSKDKFSVPPNLYIVGTMNTADRSVEALDTALRRRFSFEEVIPDPELIKSHGKLREHGGNVQGISLVELLVTINHRVEKLLDKDHLIGHSYFMNVTDLKSLKHTFQNKIIPLLQEYFYGDFGKIGLVIGKGFFINDGRQEGNDKLFAPFDDYDTSVFDERKIYRLQNVSQMDDAQFISALNTLLQK